MKYLTFMISFLVSTILSAAPSYTPEQEKQVAFCSGLLTGYHADSGGSMMKYLIEIARPTDRYHYILVREFDRGVGFVNGWHRGCKSQKNCDETSLSDGATNAWKHFKCGDYGLDNTFKTPTTTEITAPKEKKQSAKIGTQTDDEPCTCVFNKNRMWNPEKVLWKEQYWKCSIYKDDGTCSEVSIITEESE
ncbi:hypothetical protein [Aliivibrio kagoshimensis]|uniref:hypothetical protein n=1 Tax=Aliivibrio kagoshimensis TaxID=2910230 RepID=UPI003D0A6556